jgi:hypothetical protein
MKSQEEVEQETREFVAKTEFWVEKIATFTARILVVLLVAGVFHGLVSLFNPKLFSLRESFGIGCLFLLGTLFRESLTKKVEE